MNDYEAQNNDRMQTEQRLEEIMDKLERGDILSMEEVDLVRWGCGLPARPQANYLTDIFNDWANIWRKAGGL
jgi:hypothetical protein